MYNANSANLDLQCTSVYCNYSEFGKFNQLIGNNIVTKKEGEYFGKSTDCSLENLKEDGIDFIEY